MFCFSYFYVFIYFFKQIFTKNFDRLPGMLHFETNEVHLEIGASTLLPVILHFLQSMFYIQIVEQSIIIYIYFK